MKDYNLFLEDFFKNILNAGFDISNMPLDHLAYYTASGAEYDELKPEFEKLGEFVHEAMISKRRVGVFKLHKPIAFGNHAIDALELIEPKEGEKHESGWEHAEFVIENDFNEFMQDHKNVDWETSSIDRPIYSHITVSLPNGAKVKFHHMSILDCVNLEKEQI